MANEYRVRRRDPGGLGWFLAAMASFALVLLGVIATSVDYSRRVEHDWRAGAPTVAPPTSMGGGPAASGGASNAGAAR